VAENIFDHVGNTVDILCYITNAQWVTVQNNQFVGGAYAVYIDGGNGTIQTQDILVSGNSCRLQQTTSIREQVAALTNVMIAHNLIQNDTTSGASFDGIICKDGCHVIGNSVQINKGHAGIYAVGNNAIIEHNIVRRGAASNTIFTENGSIGVIVKDNLVTSAITDNGDGLHSTGNITIT
jgi:hypothetical protein